MKIFIPLIILFLLVISCNEGIAPLPVVQDPEFGGTITFIGEWPVDVQRTIIVMFKDPLNSPEDFNILNIRYIGSEIPFGSQSFDYISTDNVLEGAFEPGDYAYLAVAQSTTPSLSLERNDWYVIGIYTDSNDQTPTPLTLSEGVQLTNINITCDFNNPPPQPPSN